MTQQYEEPNNFSIIIYGVITTVGLFVMIILLTFLFRSAVQSQIQTKIANAPTEALNNLRARENELLHKYALLEDNPQLARIDINRAMELEAQAPWRNSVQLSGEAAPTAGVSHDVSAPATSSPNQAAQP